jgi:Protein of unknown function (DUF4246)
MVYYASLGSKGVTLSPVLDVFQSDEILAPQLTVSLLASLLASLAPLENVPASQQDWHPGSDGQVLDLVHPSLYPLIYGVTRRRTEPLPPGLTSWKGAIGSGDVVPSPQILEERTDAEHLPTFEEQGFTAPDGTAIGPNPDRSEDAHVQDLLISCYSKQYAWLPADVSIAEDGKATFQSYINNLHPDAHAPLYRALEQLLSASVHLLEVTLARMLARPRRAIPWAVEPDEELIAELGGDVSAFEFGTPYVWPQVPRSTSRRSCQKRCPASAAAASRSL